MEKNFQNNTNLKEFSYDEWHNKYQNEEIIDLNKYLNEKDVEIIKRLGGDIKNKIYTNLEYDILKMKILEYYKDENEELSKKELELCKSLDDTDVSKEDYDYIVKKFEDISHQLNVF